MARTRNATKAATKKFLVGTAISVWQNSGGAPTNWSTWVDGTNIFGVSPIMGGDKVGVSCDFWNNFRTDIANNAGMGCNAMRFSLEWHRIEPQRGEIDMGAVQRYHEILDCMQEHDIEPLATLHHFVHPQWFEDLGAWEKESNIPLFVSFAELCFEQFGSKVQNWCSFNEPGVFAFSGYIYGTFCPGKFFATQLAGIVVKNMLIAHTDVYHAIKALPGGDNTEVGIVHNWMRFSQKRGDWAAALSLPSYVITHIFDIGWGNEPILNYLINGKFRWNPTWGFRQVAYDHPGGGQPPFDYIGLNYYSRILLDWKCGPTCYPGEIMTDMMYAIYPEGFYDALKRCAATGAPIIVTETGIPDKDDSRRELWARRYLGALEEAVADGLDVQGLMYWTLVDNFEWSFGFHQKFGLFEWSPDMPTAERRERPSAKLIRAMFQALPGRIEKLREDGLSALKQLHGVEA